ncbi:T9SS type A sorting domain-containing protein [Flavobacterium sp. LaA7.5]|nr:T9SS type A sorting domain-containing protein [Flavobacterium salilacus subsp. altitudinum]
MKKLFTYLLLTIVFYGNAQWVQLPFEQPNLESLYFMDVNTGYVGTYSEDEELPKLFKTANGGMNWTEIALPDIGNYTKITTIHFFNDNIGFLTTDDYYNSLSTTDGGETWTGVYCETESIGEAYFKNNGTGFYYSGELAYTEDYGMNWTPIDFWGGGVAIHDIYFPNNEGDIGYMIKDWGIFKTTDNGQTWQGIGPPYEQSGHPSIHFINENVGAFCDSSVIYKTLDGGENWTYIPILDHGGYEIHVINENVMFCALVTVLKTLDGGQTWSPTYISGTSEDIQGVIDFDFPDNTTGYAITSNGLIYKLDVAAGIEDIAENTITIYPVPATDVLTINNPSELFNRNYQIVDLTGKIVATGSITTNEIAIDKLSNGMYLLKIGEKQTIKFIKE